MKTIDWNGTTVKLVENDGIVTVEITTETGVVNVNGITTWENQPDVELKEIPAEYREFIGKTQDYMEDDDEKTSFDCYIPGGRTQGTFYFPKDRTKVVRARFDYADSLEDLKEMLSDYADEKVAEQATAIAAEVDARLREAIERNGFQWQYSHSMNEYMYGWWDIVIEPGKWNEEGFVECWNIINEFNSLLGEFVDTYFN